MFKRVVAYSLMLVMMLTAVPAIETQGAINKSAYKTLTKAGEEARDSFYNHKSSVVVKVKSKSKDPQSLYDKLENVIYAETSNPNQGDYMKWDVDETETNFSVTKSGSYYYYTFTINVEYLTTLAERKKLDSEVDSMIKGFKFTKSTSTYNKIKTVYDYVCDKVTYAKSNSDKKVYSAYSALVKGKAVCQGYASLLYKTYKRLGISTRVIAGDSTFSGTSHGWNIVKLGSYYYNIDATWDSTLVHAKKNYKYFLKGDSFSGHKRWTSYAGSSFYYNYPMAAKGYSSKVAAKASTNTKIAKFKYKKPKFKNVSRKKVTFKSIKNATYQFKYSGVDTFKKKYTITVNTKKPKYKLKNIRNGVTYWIKFRARKKIGNKKYYTKWSTVKVI